MTDVPRSGSGGITLDDVNGKDGTVEATRPVRSAYGRKAPNRYGRRPTPWPDANPDPQSMNRMLRRHKVNNATQSSEEGDVFEPLPDSRKYFSKQARGKAPRNAQPVRVAAPRPSPQERPSGPSSRLDARPDSEMMASLATQVELNVTRFSSDDETAPPIPPRSPLRLSFAPGTNTQAGPSNKKKKARFDSIDPQSGHYVPGGRKLSIFSDSPGPARDAGDGSENVSDGSHESERSNPGQSILRIMGHLSRRSGNIVKRPSVASLDPDSQARARDGSKSTTGTDQRNPGAAALDIIDMYPGNSARRPLRRSVTAISKVPVDLGVLPNRYVDGDAWPGPSRSRRKRTHAIEEVEELEEEEEKDDDDERSPTDTRAPQLPLPETLPSSRPEAISQGFALNAW